MKRTLQKPLICFFLAAITFGAFAGVSRCSFLVFDDRNYVVKHAAVQHGFSWDAVKWAFTTFDCSNWHPLTWLSHILDCQLYGLNPAGHHLTNLGFHIANTILLFLLFQRLTARLWPSAFVALLFGIHPMHVESVAWVSERKDVLSTFFFVLTLLAYVRYAESSQGRDGALRRPRPRGAGGTDSQANARSASNPPGKPESAPNPQFLYYALALLFCILSLMSKPMVVTLPFVLLLLDFWPLQRFPPSTLLPGRSLATTGLRLLAEKIPFFVLAAMSCLITLKAQSEAEFKYSLGLRVAHVLRAYGWYLLKFVWPTDLSAFYPLQITDFGMDALAALLALCIITGLAIKFARTRRYLLFGWLWFLGTLVPVIGLVQAGGQAYADRYTYLPYIGLFIIIAWGIPDLLANVRLHPSSAASGSNTPSSILHPPSSPLLWAGAALVAVACFVRTVQEVAYWKDGVTLFERAIVVDPKNPVAWTCLGGEYLNQHNPQKAMDSINRALDLDPNFYLAWQYMGQLRAAQGDYAGAGDAYKKALSLAFNGEDSVYVCNSYNALGDHLFSGGEYYAAIPVFQNSLELSPGQPEIQAKLGQCLLQTQQPDKAAAAFQAAIDLQPDNPEAHAGLGMISQSSGQDSDAIAQYREALAVDSNSVVTLNNLAWLLATDSDPALRNGPEAVPLAEHACELTHYQKAFLIGTLAAAYAEVGRFDDAVAAAQKAHDVALANGEKELADKNVQLLQLYKSHQSYRSIRNHTP